MMGRARRRDDYLWDRAGSPDPLMAELERAGAELRFDPQRRPFRPAMARAPFTRGAWRRRVALAGGTVLVVAAVAAALMVASLGRPRECGPEGVGLWNDDHGCRELSVGAWVELRGERSRVVSIGGLGTLDIAPGSRLRLVESSPDRTRIELGRGTVHALVTAPPRLFQLTTPAGTAVDMGCEYTIAVDETGRTELSVLLGEVVFEAEGEAVTVPAGASTRIRPGRPAGIPLREDAPEALSRLVAAADEGRELSGLAEAMAAARPDDAVTLWYLRGRVLGRDRSRVTERLRTLVPPEPGSADDDAWRRRMPF